MLHWGAFAVCVMGLVVPHDAGVHFLVVAMAPKLVPAGLDDFCHRLVLHGRAVCTARKAKCEECCMNGFCPKKI